ncbi:MAG: hypothetical protein ACK4Q5_06100, partial [Saprospiraceae bacterium]
GAGLHPLHGGARRLISSQLNILIMLTDDQKRLLIEAVEQMIEEDFTSKPGWNFPCSSVKKTVMRIETPDGYEAKVILKLKRYEKEVQP